MQNSPVISNNKIIAMVAFVCAALMTSLFVYHASQRPTAPAISADAGILFPAPRDISSFEFLTENNVKFTEKNFYQHWTLLFFGFTHCSSVCPSTLDVMSRVYAQLHDSIPNLQVALISVDPERDTPDSLAKYVHAYNPNFIGMTGKISDLHKLQSQLGIYAARDDASPADNYQIQHTSSILLVNPQGKWAGLFKFGLTPNQLTEAVKHGVGVVG